MNQNHNNETKSINTSSATKNADVAKVSERNQPASLTPMTNVGSPIVIAIDHG